MFDVCPSLANAAQFLAHCIRTGSQLWVVALGLEDHAQHLAVEFVHPASVGAGAVPAVAITGGRGQVVDALRHQVRPGDVVVSMGDANSGFVGELSMRAQPWKVSHLHIGWSSTTRVKGMSPESLYIRLGESSDTEILLTRSYHLLWELTFICLQNGSFHLNSPTAEGALSDSASISCPVCSDEAAIAEVLELNESESARVRSSCGDEVIDVSLIDDLCTYDLVLVHAGAAIRRFTFEDSHE